jgi:hypothetical protein
LSLGHSLYRSVGVSRYAKGVRDFPLVTSAHPVSGARQASKAMGTAGISDVVNRFELEDYHSPVSSAKAKSAWSCTSISSYAFMTGTKMFRGEAVKINETSLIQYTFFLRPSFFRGN